MGYRPCRSAARLVRRLSGRAFAVRIVLLHIVIDVAVEFEMLDTVTAVKDAEPRVLVPRVRCRVKVKPRGIAQGGRNVEFHPLAGLPHTPILTIVFARADLERDRSLRH